MNTSRRKWPTTSLLLLGGFIATRLLFWLLPNVFESWNAQTIDQLFVLRSSSELWRPVYDDTVAHVDLNNTTIERLKSHYLNRSHFAAVVHNLAAMHVSAQVYDFIFAARLDEENDRQLVSAVAEAGHVYFGLAFELRPTTGAETHPGTLRGGNPYLDESVWRPVVQGDARGFYAGVNPLLSFRELTSAARATGSLSVKFDRDGVLRRIPLLVKYADGFHPFLSFRVICDYLGVSPENIIVRPGRQVVLRGAKRPGDSTTRDIIIPVDRHGNMIVNFIGPWGRMDHYNFADVLFASDDRLEFEMWEEELEGRIVVVSDVSTGATDVGPVPTDTNFPLSGLHTSVMHTILTESFLQEFSAIQMLIVEGVLLGLIFLMSLRLRSIPFSLGTMVLAVSFVATGCAGFLYANLIVNMVRPIVMVTLATTSILVYRYITEEREKMEGLRQRDLIRATFGRYLSNEVVEEILGTPEGLTMSGEIREVTFLVTDLRGFTSMSARLSPHEIIHILNRYFENMIEIAGRYRGTVNEFRGDGLLVFFGAPLASRDDPERAVACAIHMQNALQEINEIQTQQDLPELGMGIGIHTGDVVVGNIGSEKRAAYTAVGGPINTAFRIESYTVGGQILISPNTYERVSSLVKVRDTLRVQFKGLDNQMTLYDVNAIDGKYALSLRASPAVSLFTLRKPLAIHCFPIEGKAIGHSPLSGRLARLSESGAELSLEGELGVHANVEISLNSQSGKAIPGVYGKITSVEKIESESSRMSVRLRFTSVSEEARSFIRELLQEIGETEYYSNPMINGF